MSLRIRNFPQGVSSYPDASSYPPILGVTQWCTPDINMAKIFLGYAGVPVWAELGNQSVTVPIVCYLLRCPGNIANIEGVYFGNSGQLAVPVNMTSPFPFVGDPNGLVKFTGTVTFNLNDGNRPDVGIPLHGWTRFALQTRTIFTNADQVDTQLVIPFYSAIDTTQPEVQLGEAGIQLTCKSTNAISHLAQEGDVFGIHLVEIRDQSIPILAPISQSFYERVFGYSYGLDPVLNSMTSCFTYTAVLDSDPFGGTANPTTLTTQGFGNGGNFDTLDALVFSKSTAPAGLGPNQHRLELTWAVDTDKGFIDQYGKQEPGDIELKSQLIFLVSTGPNPQPAPALQLLPIPGVLGKTLADATSSIVAAGFRVGDVANCICTNPNFQPGQVFSQSPAQGPQPLPPGTLINLSLAFSVNPLPPPPPIPPCVPNIPTVTVSSPQTINPGTSATFTVTVTNNDLSTCQPRAFTVTAQAS